MRPLLHALRAFSVLELVSVVVLILNMATVRIDQVTSVLGPVHAGFYLCVVVTALLGRGLMLRTRLLAAIPVLGGVLTLLNVRMEAVR